LNYSGQVSIEYLLLIAALVSVFSVAVISLEKVFSAASFAIDSHNASAFISELGAGADVLSMLGDCSRKEFSGVVASDWAFSGSGKNIFLILSVNSTQKKFRLPEGISLSNPFKIQKGKFSVALQKVSGSILLVNNDLDFC